MNMLNADRPSRHGALLGEALALIAKLGRRNAPSTDFGECCATCAFRPGSVPNQSAGTGKIALECVLGRDEASFGCHHGMKNGEPKRLCAGYIAAYNATYTQVREVVTALLVELDKHKGKEDEVRTAFDAWLKETDPEGKMDVYQVARAYLSK